MADTGATLAYCAEVRRRARRPTAFDGGGDGLGGGRLDGGGDQVRVAKKGNCHEVVGSGLPLPQVSK